MDSVVKLCVHAAREAGQEAVFHCTKSLILFSACVWAVLLYKAMFLVFSKMVSDPMSEPDKQIAERLIMTLTTLTQAEDVDVRCTVASSLHEVHCF